MTAANKPPLNEYQGDGVTVDFAADFRFNAPSHVQVRLIAADGSFADLAYGSAYSVTGGSTDAGGTVRMAVAPPVGSRLQIRRSTPRDQSMNYTTTDTFPAESHEAALDKAMLVDQEQDVAIGDVTDRALMVPVGETSTPVPARSARVGRFLAWDAGGNPVAASGTGNDAALRSDVAAAGGAALVGVAGGGTLQDDLDAKAQRISSAVSAAAHFWQRIKANTADVPVMIGSDSTGNEPGEWPRLMADWFASMAPTHGVEIRYWDDGAADWGAYSVIQAGSGDHSILIDVCAVAGKNSYYLQGAMEPAIFERGDYVLAILNYGHNLGTDAREAQMFDECLIAAAHMQWRAPYAAIFVTAQNPRTSEGGALQSAAAAATWRKIADLTGCALIDVWTRFMANPNFIADWMADETHPNNAGQSGPWLDAVKAALAPPVSLDAALLRPPGVASLDTVGVNLLRNPMFAAWDGGPVGWTLTNCTARKEPGRTEGAPYALELKAGATAGSMLQALPLNLVTHLRGKRVLALARIWKEGASSGLSGRISVTCANGVSSVSGSSAERGAQGADGFHWAIASLDVMPDATSVDARVFTGNDTDDDKRLWLTGMALFVGATPRWLSTEPWSDMVVDEYFSSYAVVPKPGDFDGVLTVADDGFEVTGASPGETNVVVNLPPLEAGATYRLTFDTGAGDGSGGGVFARSGLNGDGTTLANLPAWSPSATGFQLDFTPTSAIASLWFYTFSLGTGMEMTNVSIVKL